MTPNLKLGVNVIAGMAAIASALVSVEAFSDRLDPKWKLVVIGMIVTGGTVSATGADLKSSIISLLLFGAAFQYLPLVQNVFPALKLSEIEEFLESFSSPSPSTKDVVEEEKKDEENFSLQ